jgi:DNA-binding MarR family transcriptional regulator
VDAVELAARLRVATARLNRAMRQNDGTEMGPTLVAALVTIAREGPMTLGDLAAAEQVAPPSITKVAARLVEEGLAERSVDTDDRRVVWIAVTDAGRRHLEASRRRRTTWLASRLDGFTPDELAILDAATALLTRIVEPDEGRAP